MGFALSGFVLRAPRVAPSNAVTTDEAANGVQQDYKPLPEIYKIPSPPLVSLAEDQYRAATLLDPEDATTEYLIFAANTANLSSRAGFQTQKAKGSIGTGTLSVTQVVPDPNPNNPYDSSSLNTLTDGTNRIFIFDDANRSIAEVTQLIVRRGDTGADIALTTQISWNPVTNTATVVGSTALAELGGGLSLSRGDTVRVATVTLSAPTFWWTRNDKYETRFAWDGQQQRWAPLKGTPVRNLGVLLKNESYILSPAPRVTVGEYLPGDSGEPDAYAMVRLGKRPDSSSLPVAKPGSGFGGILVVADDAVEDYDFSNSTDAGVVGETTGELVFNPAFVEQEAGQTIFYSYQGFIEQTTVEPIGLLESAGSSPLFIAPIPGPTDYPFIRIGNREPLEAILVDTDALLGVLTLDENQVGVSLSTGKLKFSETDVNKANPETTEFDSLYLGAEVFYDGVSLSQRPLPTKAPVQLVGNSGQPTQVGNKNELYLPLAEPTLSPGVSGVQYRLDGTGFDPDISINPSIRPNKSGLVRDIRGSWDFFFFGEAGQIERVRLVDDDDEIPKFAFNIPKDTAIVDLRPSTFGSRVYLSREGRRQFNGKPLYFIQTAVQPSVWYDQARLFSRVRGTVFLTGTEVFVFRIDSNQYVWQASSNPGGINTSQGGSFSVSEIATSLNAVIGGGGQAIVLGDRLALQTNNIINGKRWGDIEIGFGPNGTRDLSGPTALGFLPGWLIRIPQPEQGQSPFDEDASYWAPDNGTHLGVFRSPLNLSGERNIADTNHIGRYEDEVIVSSISTAPFVLLDRPPLENIPGYDDGVFFRFQRGLRLRTLKNFEDVYYDFGQRRLFWANEESDFSFINQPVVELRTSQTRLITSSFRLPQNGLSVSTEGSVFEKQELNVDYLVLDEGTTGRLALTNAIGESLFVGGRGQFTQGSTLFSDTSSDVDFLALGVVKGDLLQIQSGSAEGIYTVASDPTSSNQLQVTPPFVATDSTVPWEIFRGDKKEGTIADVQYVQFQHLPTEPFRVRALTKIGIVPGGIGGPKLKALVSDALNSGRKINLRFGLPNASPTADLIPLTQTNLGEILNGVRAVPAPTSERFVNGNFSIQVGDKNYNFGDGSLVKVPGALSFPLTGDVIEVQEGSGLLNFGTDVFTKYQGSDAIYVEEFLDPATSPVSLPQGKAEFSPLTGEINLSLGDIADFPGFPVYFVELMVTTSGQDVTLNPIGGSFLFTTPLRDMQIVEAEYFLAQTGTGDLLLEPNAQGVPSPVRVVEFLPLTVNREKATPTNVETQWKFNPTGRTVRADIDPTIYIGSTICNVGSSPEAFFDATTSTITFKTPVPSIADVRITYYVNEAFGGEQSYTTSRSPVFRPPFRIEPDRDFFVLESNRTDLVPGQLLRVGEFTFYLLTVTYDPAEDETTVTFFPPTQQEVGSRDPSTDSISVLSNVPLYKGANPNAFDDFFTDITASYDPVNRGFQDIIFDGDLTGFAIPGHILEIASIPFVITGSQTIDDNTRTKVTIASYFPRGFNSDQDKARVSLRPIYAPFPTSFVGPGPFLSSEPFEAILFGETKDGVAQPGRTLRNTIDYVVDFATGAIQFLNPPQGALQPTQSLYFRRVSQRGLAPTIKNGQLVLPKYLAKYVHVTQPSESNNLLRGILRASYTYSAPDTWYYRTVPLVEYLGEVADDVARGISSLLPSNGSKFPVIPPIENKTQGRLGLRSQLRDLQDRDRAARVFLDFYNQVVLAYEQVLETMSGDIIGDRDGKFKFFVGRDKEIPPPGYEDPITGVLNRRNIFSELWFGYNRDVIFLSRDPLVDPDAAFLDDDQLVGRFIDPDLLDDLRNQQKELIQNDVDDIVLVSRTRKRLRLFPLRLESFGRYRLTGQPSRFSRIFPERAEAFTLTDPGIGGDLESDPVKPGVYSFRKRVRRFSISGDGIKLPKRASTFGKAIGEISNPVLGQMTNISAIQVRPRLPRARVYAYSPVGFPELDDAIIAAGGIPFGTFPRPAVIATPLPLQQFPLARNGMPDVELLAAQGGEVIDLSTGDPDLFTPAFFTIDEGKPKVAIGRPDGRILDIVTNSFDAFQFPPGTDVTVLQSVFVKEVLLGCVLTFSDGAGNLITNAENILDVSEDADAASGPITIFRGDTIFITPPDVDVKSGGDPNQPSTAAELEAQVQGLPGYRIDFDLKVDQSDGEYVDNTFPSFKDPSILGLKEILGQRPPGPLTNLEAQVRFRNSQVDPVRIPALEGEPFNDSGDYTLPYLVAPNTEIQRLGVAQQEFNNLFVDSPEPGAIYPDEVQGVDGQVITTFSFPQIPGTFRTGENLTPAYSPNQGIGPTRQYDLFLVETGQTSVPPGTQGVLSIGDVTSNTVEVPRFVTPTAFGSRFRYEFRNAMAFVNQPSVSNPPGIVVSRVGNDTFFDITSISTGFLVFNDGTPAVAVGGLNAIFNPAGIPYPNNANRITINLFDPNGPTYLQSVVIDIGAGAPTATGDAGAQPIAVLPTATDNIITVNTALPFVSIGFGPAPQLPEDPLNPGASRPLWFTVDIDTSDGNTVGSPAGSNTGYIDTDRLSFVEAYDLRTVESRDESPVDGFDVRGQLSVYFVTGGGSDAVTVNAPPEVNGGSAFTFPRRAGNFTAGGQFNMAGQGRIKVASFEGFNNNPIVSTGDVVFSALPSSNYDEEGIICQGTGVCESALTNPDLDNRLTSPVVLNGDLAKVEAGDVCVITGVSGQASTKVGSYLVKFATPQTGFNPYYETTLSKNNLPFNTGAGWAQVRFPLLVSVDMSLASIVVEGGALEDGSSAFPVTGRLYFIRDVQDITQTISLQYVGFDVTTGTFSVLQNSGLEADGITPVADAIFSALPVGTVISGFSRLDIRWNASGDISLNRNSVGYLGDGATTFGAGGSGLGVRNITLNSSLGAPQSFDYELFGISGPFNTIVNNSPGVDQLAVYSATPVFNGVFQSDPDAVVYPNVADVLDLSGLSTGPGSVWDNLHGGLAPGVDALFPLDVLDVTVRMQAGVFLEPSFPRPVQNLNNPTPMVVDAFYSLNPTQIGFRDGPTYGTVGPFETVNFEIRRIRRFHTVLENIASNLAPLRFVYEKRRGVVTGYGSQLVGPNNTAWPYVIDANGTNLGPFDDENVGIFPNDIFRLFDLNGNLIDEVEIAAVESGTRLVLKAPGITKTSTVTGLSFEIYLRNPPVPQEQNGDQLLDLITEQVLVDRKANLTTQQGGFVAAEIDPLAPRSLQDTDASVNFVALGVQEGDILIIDPAGELFGPTGVPATGQERGTRPFGDRSVPSRTLATSGQAVPFQAGQPSELDDNRGFYRIVEVSEKKVTVEAGHTFAGDNGLTNVIFGDQLQYAVLPTISASTAPFASPTSNGVEGQNDLRPTEFAGQNGSPPNSFRGNMLSIAPFSYKIIRPSSLFSEEAVDVALFLRERNLSFMDEFQVFFENLKSGNYYVFQRDRHIRDLGNPLIPDEGLGVMSNELINGIRGEVAISPFANTSDCLSILDRRFFINDFRLDNEFPPNQTNVPSYAVLESNANNTDLEVGDGRPVLPDYIDDVLNNNDQFRELRYTWLAFRTNQQDGTLALLESFESEFNKRRADQIKQIKLRRALGGNT